MNVLLGMLQNFQLLLMAVLLMLPVLRLGLEPVRLWLWLRLESVRLRLGRLVIIMPIKVYV